MPSGARHWPYLPAIHGRCHAGDYEEAVGPVWPQLSGVYSSRTVTVGSGMGLVREGDGRMRFGSKHRQREPEVGAEVLTNDGECLGDVAAVHDDELEVTGGTMAQRVLWRVPRSAISRIDQQTMDRLTTSGEAVMRRISTSRQTIYLNVSCHQARSQGWDHSVGTGRGR